MTWRKRQRKQSILIATVTRFRTGRQRSMTMVKAATSNLILGLVALLVFAGRAHADRPNVVLIMVDDASWECFGCYGGEDYQTPHIDNLAAKGVRFQHCYSTPICTPSRVMIMTGKYTFRNYTHFGYLNPKEKTFGNLMKSAGYKIAIAGKCPECLQQVEGASGYCTTGSRRKSGAEHTEPARLSGLEEAEVACGQDNGHLALFARR